MDEIRIRPIGVIRTPFIEIVATPIQPIAAEGITGRLEIQPEYEEGLEDLAGFSHITLLYYFHRVHSYALKVVPFMDTVERGVFATKAPKRPNHIGVSTVKLLSISGTTLEVEGVDMLDGTPLLDIKPFYPRYDNRDNVTLGWIENHRDFPLERMKADSRFAD